MTEGNPQRLVGGDYVLLEVTDTGEGMDAHTLNRALEPLFTTKGVGKGTGLGLPMVEGLAAQSGGRFELKSERGKGTTAQLWLPVALPTAAPPGAPAAHLSLNQVPSMTVLAVDDDGLVLMNTVAILEELGHTVVQAGSAEAALAILRQDERIGLMVTDHMMPKMTGAQLIGVVRSELPKLRVILATGYAELPAELGADILRLPKPFGPDELAAAIAHAVTSVAA